MVVVAISVVQDRVVCTGWGQGGAIRDGDRMCTVRDENGKKWSQRLLVE